jgi:hypothetical protein
MRRRGGFGGSEERHRSGFWSEHHDLLNSHAELRSAIQRGNCQDALNHLIGSARRLSRMDGNRVWIENIADGSEAFRSQREQEDKFHDLQAQFRQKCLCGGKR